MTGRVLRLLEWVRAAFCSVAIPRLEWRWRALACSLVAIHMGRTVGTAARRGVPSQYQPGEIARPPASPHRAPRLRQSPCAN